MMVFAQSSLLLLRSWATPTMCRDLVEPPYAFVLGLDDVCLALICLVTTQEALKVSIISNVSSVSNVSNAPNVSNISNVSNVPNVSCVACRNSTIDIRCKQLLSSADV